jgi:hypothetical protein
LNKSFEKIKKDWFLRIREIYKDIGSYSRIIVRNCRYFCFKYITKFGIIISEVGNIK